MPCWSSQLPWSHSSRHAEAHLTSPSCSAVREPLCSLRGHGPRGLASARQSLEWGHRACFRPLVSHYVWWMCEAWHQLVSFKSRPEESVPRSCYFWVPQRLEFWVTWVAFSDFCRKHRVLRNESEAVLREVDMKWQEEQTHTRSCK